MNSEVDAVIDLPNYRIRQSARAKRVLLKMSLYEGLVVVVPSGFDLRQVPKILERRMAWLEHSIKRVEEQRRVLGKSAWELPHIMFFRAINEKWKVEYRLSQSIQVVERQCDNHTLVLFSKNEDPSLNEAALREFLMRKANHHLTKLLRAAAKKHDFDVNKVSVRLQRTRWGSCSKQGNISLNAKLLFLPYDLVNYVIMHELCHTVHHNHSRNFWLLMEKQLPKTQDFRRAIRTDSWRFIPPWLETCVEHRDIQDQFYELSSSRTM